MFQTKVTDKVKRDLMFNKFFHSWCRLCDNVEKYCRAGQAMGNIIVQSMRFACWIPKATDMLSEYVILIAFPLQQWLYKCTSMLHYMNIACLVIAKRPPPPQKRES